MVAYRIESLPQHVAAAARRTLRSPQYGHPAHVELAKGYGPCRSCLRQFRIGQENRLLFTFNPFDGVDPYPSPGPIFIHEHECEVYDGDGFPPELRTLPLMLEGYGTDRECVIAARATGDAIDAAIARILSLPAVRYLHIRNAEAGCFIAHIARAAE